MPPRKVHKGPKRKKTVVLEKSKFQKIKGLLKKNKVPLSALLATASGALILKKINSGKKLTPKQIEELEKIKNEAENSPDNLQGNLMLPSPPPPPPGRPGPPPPPPPPPPPMKKHEVKIKKGTSPIPQGFKPPSEADPGGVLKKVPSHGLSIKEITDMKPRGATVGPGADQMDFGKSTSRKAFKKSKLKTLKKDLILLLRLKLN